MAYVAQERAGYREQIPAVADVYAIADDELHPLRARGPKYPPHHSSAPVFEGIDILGLAVASVITLAPLAAYSVGLGA